MNSALDDLKTALAGSPEATAEWIKLPPSHQREHLVYIEEAKKADTRSRRIQKTVETLIQKR